MRRIFQILSILWIFLIWSFISVSPVSALRFELIAPSGILQRGQEVVFTIRIDPEGESLTNAVIGLAYDTQYLEFLNAIPGDTFDAIATEEIEFGKLVLTGTDSQPVSSEGVFAQVKFRLIADAPGATQLCSFFNPEVTPTPTTPPSTPAPTTPPTAPTATPPPPVSGQGDISDAAILFGGIGVLGGVLLLILRSRLPF